MNPPPFNLPTTLDVVLQLAMSLGPAAGTGNLFPPETSIVYPQPLFWNAADGYVGTLDLGFPAIWDGVVWTGLYDASFASGAPLFPQSGSLTHLLIGVNILWTGFMACGLQMAQFKSFQSGAGVKGASGIGWPIDGGVFGTPQVPTAVLPYPPLPGPAAVANKVLGPVDLAFPPWQVIPPVGSWWYVFSNTGNFPYGDPHLRLNGAPFGLPAGTVYVTTLGVLIP